MELRPLGFGEIFDRAVTLYIRNFIPFAAIVMVLIVPFAILEYVLAVTEGPEYAMMIRVLTNPEVARTEHIATILDSPSAIVTTLLVLLLAYLIAPFVMNAVAVGVARLYRDRRVEFRACYEAVLHRWPQIIGLMALEFVVVIGWYLVVLLVVLAFVFITMALVAVVPVVGVFLGILAFFVIFILALLLLAPLLVALAFAMYAVVIEERDVIAALQLGFSRVLNRTEFWRAMLFAIAVGAIAFGASTMFSILGILAAMVHLAVLQAIVQTLPTAVINPFVVIVFAIYYFDVRIRREGYDLEASLERLNAAEPA